MSERLEGVPPPPPPSTPRDSSVVVLFRRGPGGVEVFWLEREQKLAFAGGFYAFPGGRVDQADRAISVVGATGEAATLIASAARELFEETGVLQAHGAEALSQARLDELRRRLLDDAGAFAAILGEEKLALHAADFHPAGRWVTPPYSPRRFDARFFLVEAMPTHQASVWKGELVDGAWIRPAEALERWEAGTALLHPPNLHALEVMARFTDVPRAVAALAAQPFCTADFIAERIEMQRGVTLFPLETATLPPASHTNCYVLGTGELLVVDPGATEAAELERLVTLLRAMEGEGRQVKAVVLTHHHGDHSGGAALLASRLGVPVWAHALTRDRVEVPVARLLEEGETLVLAGPLEMRWKVLHTPGHARGHVTLVDERSRAAVVGDMVAGLGTIVIDPPEGNMGEYLRQLKRLEALPVRTLYPAHGPTIPDGPAKLNEYAQHRAWREQRVLDALASFTGPAKSEELVEKAYDDVAAFVWPIAERNTAAILEKLVEEGRVTRQREGFVLSAPAA